jgi:type II secretory ATPase GspE/PulE/Tfp pilus assembly ATPase PilB-like protein
VVERYLLGDALAMSQAQRLVKKLCGYCKRAISVNDRVQELFYSNGVIKEPTNDPIFMAEGCEECNGTGFLDRVAIMEMCSVDQTIAEMVSSGASMAEMRKEAAKQGVLSLYQEGLNQVILGNTTLEEIVKLSHFGSMS